MHASPRPYATAIVPPWEKGLLAAFIVVSLAFPFIRTIDFLANNTLADASFSEGSIWLQAVFGPLFLLAAIQAWHHGRWTFRVLRTANPFLLAVIAWAALTVLWSPYPEVTVKRSIQQMGLVLIGLSLTLPFVSHDFFARVLHRALIALLIVSFIVVLLFPSVGIDRLREGGWHGILWHKNTLGVVACFATVLGVYRIARNDGDRRGQLALLVFALFMLVMSRSSTALLSGLLGSGFFLFLRKPYLGGRYALPQIGLVLGIAVALVLLLAFLALGRLPGWDDLAAPLLSLLNKSPDLTGRTELWVLVQQEIARHPIQGIGYGAFWLNIGSPSQYVIDALNWIPLQAHNGYIDLLNELGWIGVCLFAAMLLWHLASLIQLGRHDRDLAALHGAFFLLILVSNLSESQFFSGVLFQNCLLIYSSLLLSAHNRVRDAMPGAPRGAG